MPKKLFRGRSPILGQTPCPISTIQGHTKTPVISGKEYTILIVVSSGNRLNQ